MYSIGYFLFDFPQTLFEVLKEFVAFIATPLPQPIQDAFIWTYTAIVKVINFWSVLFGFDLSPLTDYFYDIVEKMVGSPFAVWALVFSITLGFVFAFVFLVLDILDRINFLT